MYYIKSWTKWPNAHWPCLLYSFTVSMNNLRILLHKLKLHRFGPNGDIVTFLPKELRVGFSVGSVMIWTIRFYLFYVPKCLDIQDKYEKNCSFSFLGWRIFSFLKSGIHDKVSSVEMFLFTWGVVRCCSPVDLNVFSSWKCLCWGAFSGTHIFALVLFALGHYQHCLITFLAFIGMLNVGLYSSEVLLLLLSAVTWSKQCPLHVQHMWFGFPANFRMFSSVLLIHLVSSEGI